jgi:hypothetical protein
MYQGQPMKVRELYPVEGEATAVYEVTFICWTSGRKAVVVRGDGGDFVVPLDHVVAPLGCGLVTP